MKKEIWDKWYMDKGIRMFKRQYPSGLLYQATINKYNDQYDLEVSLCKEYDEGFKYLIDGRIACDTLSIAKTLEICIRSTLELRRNLK